MHFFQAYLSRLESSGSFDCACGRSHRLGARQVSLGERVLEDLPAQLRDRYGRGVRLWLLSDENTERAAGARCKELLAGWTLQSTVLPGSPKPRPTLELAGQLAREAGERSPGLVLAVGSGVISDLGKKVSHDLGVPNWCVATAPSVDAFSSGHSVFKTHSRHQSIPSTPAEAIFCELEVLAAAPRALFLSGLGDLLGKFLAYLDWHLSELVTGEYVCPEAARIARDSALATLRALGGGRDTRAVLVPLMDALLTTGFLMQALGSSRPASSAEHTAAHLWELAGLVGDPQMNLHGLLVALGSHCTLQVYRSFFGALPQIEPRDRLRALENERPWEEQLPLELDAFREHIRAEISAAETGPAVWARHLAAYAGGREPIRRLAGEALRELKAGIATLQEVGLAFDPRAFGLSPSAAYLPFPNLRLLRHRYNTFWLMHELGAEELPLRALRERLAID